MTAIVTFLPAIAQKWIQFNSSFDPGKLHPSLISRGLWNQAFRKNKKLIITAGMYGAGTTWTHNVLLNALGKRGFHTHAAYAEKLGFPLLMKLRTHDALLVKAHALSVEDGDIVRASHSRVLIPIRDPRDAVCSLMERFGFSFEEATARVALCASNILSVQMRLPHKMLRYEDRFIERMGSIGEVMGAAGLKLIDGEAEELHEVFSANRVRNQVEKAVSAGSSYWRGFDNKTQWHRNHLGDGKIGKFKTKLSMGQIQILEKKLQKFLREFDYAA